MKSYFLILISTVIASCKCLNVDSFCPGKSVSLIFIDKNENAFFGDSRKWNPNELSLETIEGNSSELEINTNIEGFSVLFIEKGTYVFKVADLVLDTLIVQTGEAKFDCCSTEEGVQMISLGDKFICEDHRACTLSSIEVDISG